MYMCIYIYICIYDVYICLYHITPGRLRAEPRGLVSERCRGRRELSHLSLCVCLH